MTKDNKEEVEKSAEQELEKRVDEMLDPSKPDSKPIKPAFVVLPNEDNYNSEVKTAPLVGDDSNGNGQRIEPESDETAEDNKIDESINSSENAEAEVDEPSDDKTADAVDEIIANESDELLAVEDEKIAKAFDDKKPNLIQKIKNFFINWWNNKRARWITIIAVFLMLVVAAIVPTSRYFLLNSVGIRSSASVIVLDESTQQPLKNVSVKLRGKTALTDDNGKAVLSKLKLGRTDLMIEKRAFATDTKKITLGWGSNPLGSTKLTPVGVQYNFLIKDYFSNKPIAKAEAINGEFSAFSDQNGKIKLTIDNSDAEFFNVEIKGQGLRDEPVKILASEKDDHEVTMVPWRKHVFISKRNGKYDLYKIDADGKNEELVLAGSGVEREDITLVPHPSQEKVALVSTRENVRNQDGYLLSTLTVIDLATNVTVKVAQSERIQIIDWINDQLIYVAIKAGASAANPQRHKLKSYNIKTEENKDLASSNFFNDVMVSSGYVYYALSSAYATEPAGFFKINADGSGKQTILAKEVWNIVRTNYDKLVLSTGDSWYEVGSDNYANKLNGEPSDLKSRAYFDNPSKKKSLWVDQRDGKGVLITYDIEKKSDNEPTYSQSGLRAPISWLNDNTIVFRIVTDQETADYVVSTDGGDPKKIKNVTDTTSTDEWYYY